MIIRVNDDGFKGVLDLLKNTVPEFHSVFDDDDGAYPVLGEFGGFILKNLKNPGLMLKCFGFINESLTETDYRLDELFAVQLFEQLYEDKEGTIVATQLLSRKALELFKRNSSHPN
jgi:hypothetical protein